MVKQMAWAALVAALVLTSACKSDDGEDDTCVLHTHEGCEDDHVCEEVVDGEPACFAPITIAGRVFDLSDDTSIEGATVVARDANGAARSDVARTDADGSYALQVPTLRTADGMPADVDPVTLSVAADGYQVFPRAPRTALPIDLEVAVDDAGAGAVDNPATQVALIPLESGDGVTVEGSLGADGAGALVVAETGGSAVSTAVADLDGSFILFNVPQGDVQIGAWGQGLHAAPQTVAVDSDGAQDVSLEVRTDVEASVSGNVSIVDAPGGSTTSVILVLESTFDEQFVRGEAPPGLRVAGVTGAFRFEDVPPGRYAVLAAYENDDLVRDPDEGIGGTDIVYIEVPGSGEVSLDSTFKVTAALDTVAPGAEALEAVGPSPTLEWGDDSSEDGYELHLYDTFGQLIFEDTEVPRVTGSPSVRYMLTDASLKPGMVYQFRAYSWRERGGGERRYISATEDLRGTFQVE